MHICQSLIVRAASCPEEVDPKIGSVEPSGPKVRDAFDGDSIDLRDSKVSDHRSNCRRSAAYQICRARHGPPDASRLGQYLLDERPSLLTRKPGASAASPRRQRSSDRLFPPLHALQIQVQEQDGTRGGPLQRSRIGSRPSAPVRIRSDCRQTLRSEAAPGQQGHATPVQPPHGLQMSHDGPPPLRQFGRCSASIVVSHSPIHIHRKGSAMSDAHNQYRVHVSLDFPRNVAPTFRLGPISHQHPENILRRTSSRTTRSPANFDALN